MKVKPKEGVWFKVLLNNKIIVGLAARTPARQRRWSIVFGYFFGPFAENADFEAIISTLVPDQALLVTKFTGLYIEDGAWPLIPIDIPWNREQWPMPPFSYKVPISNRIVRRTYCDNDCRQLLKEETCTLEEALLLPRDGIYGAEAAEIALGQLLNKETLYDPLVTP